MRPVIFKKDATWTWDIRLSNSSGALDADSTPTVTVYKNGTATGESVTVTKPSATTGWYQCSFNPAGESELDVYGFAENVTISSVAQPPHHWHAVVVSPEIVASDISTSVWANGTRTLSAGTNIVLAKGTGLTGFNDIDAAGIRTAVGLSSANLDTQLSTIDSAVDNCESAALQLLGVEGDVQVVIREAVGLDGATLTNDLKFISDSCAMIVRSTSDTSAISFMYPAPSLSLTGQVSINDGNFQAVAGAVTFLRSEGDQYFYSLAYNASDRPSSEGTARYTFSNSGNHVHVMLRVEQVSLSASGIRSAVGLASANLDTQLTAIDDFLDTEIAAIKAKTDNLPATPASTSDVPSAATVASTVWSNATRTLSAGTNIVLAKGTGVTGFNDLDAAGVRSAVGLASANLDTQLVAIDDFLDTEVSAIKAKTDNLPSSPAAVSNIPTVVQIRQEMDSNSVKLSEIKSLAILGSGDQSSADFSDSYYDAVADAVLSRNVSNVEDGLAQHTLGGAILGQLEWSIDGSGNLTVYKTDGATELYTKVVNSAVSDGNVITGLE